MAFNLKLPKFLAGSKATKDQVEATATIVDDSSSVIVQKSGAGAGPLSEWSVTKKLQVLGIILILVMGSIGAVVYYNNRESSYNTAYVAAAGEMQMLSQRLAKASAMAPQGEQWAQPGTADEWRRSVRSKGSSFAGQRAAKAAGTQQDLGCNQ